MTITIIIIMIIMIMIITIIITIYNDNRHAKDIIASLLPYYVYVRTKTFIISANL